MAGTGHGRGASTHDGHSASCPAACGPLLLLLGRLRAAGRVLLHGPRTAGASSGSWGALTAEGDP
jgi:hypothetical protein